MTSSPSSRILTLGIVCLLALSVAVPAAAVSVSEANYAEEKAVGEEMSVSVTLEEPFKDPPWDTWTLQGETALENVTWTVRLIDQTGTTSDIQSYDGQELNNGNGVQVSTDQDVDQIVVEIVGDVPAVEQYTYPDEERFLVAELVQTRGNEGNRDEIGAWGAHHYTTGDSQEPGSQQARSALDSAQAAIDAANAAGADTSAANQSLQNAIQFYESGQFQNAIDNAETAEEEANAAREDVESSRQTQQLLMYAGLVVLVLAVLGGGFWYYREQQDSYDKLG